MVSGLKRTPGRDAAPCKHLGELGGDGIAAGGGGGGDLKTTLLIPQIRVTQDNDFSYLNKLKLTLC